MNVKQLSFAGGELSPLAYARADLERYATSLRTCMNFIPTIHGALRNRPGLQYCGETEDEYAAKLAAFTFSDGVTLVFEISPFAVRVYRDGALEMDGGDPVVIEDEEGDPLQLYCGPGFSLEFTQCGDVITAFGCHYDGTVYGMWPYEITYSGYTDGVVQLTAAPKAFGLPADEAVSGLEFVGSPDEEGDETHPPKYWGWYVTAVMADGRETPMQASALTTTSGTVALYPDKPEVGITWSAAPGAVAYLVYRGRFGRFGLLGPTTELFFYEDGSIEPDYTHPPPRAEYWANPAVTCAGYFQQRMVLGVLPNRLSFSETACFDFFDVLGRTYDSAPVELYLASRFADNIRHMAAVGPGIVCLTDHAEYLVTGGSDGKLTPAEWSVLAQSQVGCAIDVAPAVAGSNVLFATPTGHIRDLAYTAEQEAFAGADLSLLAEHLFEGLTVKDMSWQEDASTLWVVLSDGSLATLTYLKEEKLWGWSRQETSGGTFLAVTVAREANRDVPYFLVVRGSAIHVERLTDRNLGDLCDAIYVDCALTFDGRNQTGIYGTVTSIFEGTGFDRGDKVTITASVSLFAETDINDYFVVGYGTEDECWFQIQEVVSATEISAEAQADVPTVWRTTFANSDWAFARKRFAAVPNPWGTSALRVLADGYDAGEVSQLAGVFTLAKHAVVVQAGLAYESEAELLDISDVSGDFRTKVKRVSRVWCELKDTAGLEAGAARDGGDAELHELTRREVGDAFSRSTPLRTGLYEVRAHGTWEPGGRAIFRQSAPLPATILSVIREVTLGGK